MENSSNTSATVESTTQNQNEIEAGCGCNNITISVNPTTGGQFDLAVTKNDTIENLKKLISKKLKVPKERICLLHRERQLRDGTIQENQLVNGSRLTLLPSVETGLLAQRPEQSVMQALESLNDCQVNDFLSGKAPLNLTMRLGDHMMLIQLQLSTVTPNSSSQSSTSSSTTTTSSSSSSSTTLTSSSNSSPLSGSKRVTLSNNKPQQSMNKTTVYSSNPNQIKDPLASLSSIVESATAINHLNPAGTPSTNPTTSTTNARVNGSMTSNASVPLPSTQPSSNTQPKMSTLPSLTSSSSTTTSTTSIPSSSSSSKSTTSPTLNSTTTSSATTSPSSSTSSLLEGCKCDSASTLSTTSKPTLDTRALAEASRNLTQTLKQLSSEVLTSKSDPVEDVSTSTKRRQGAIIESMHHHGKGVYSGTFSGTLNPALQDRFGRPKRDISTIIHILNDLLCATPQYRNCRGAASTTNSSSSTSNSNGSNGEKSSSNTQPAASVTTDSEGTTSSLSTSESLENQATRGKMERLRLIMEERREKRRAARSSPYARNSGGQTNGLHVNNANGLNHTQWSANAKSETQRTNPSPSSNTASDQPNLPMDTDLCSQPEVSPEPVVA